MKLYFVRKVWIFFLFYFIQSPISAQENQPNILWLTSEDNSVDCIGCYGNPYAETPNIDQLATEGFQYMHTYANAPVCAPTRSTWITGVMALSMGTHPMRSFYDIPDSIEFYPDILRANGYFTANYKKRDFNIGNRDNLKCWDHPDEPDWNKLKQNQPFFQVLNFGDSHESAAFGDIDSTHHDPAKTTLAKYHPDVPEMRKNYAHYHDAIKKMDAKIGAAIDKLSETGLADNTIVIYVSDHGGVLPRSKRFLFKSGIHCPLIIRIPERFKQLWPAEKTGSKIDRLVSFVDMPKTWLSITGSTVPEYMQGRIFLGPDIDREQEYHFAFRGRADERVENARALNNKRYLYIRNYMPYVPWMQRLEYLWKMKATQAWVKAVEDGTATEVQSRFFSPKGWTEELYDMQNDPDCVNNLISDPKHKLLGIVMGAQLRKRQLEIFDSGLLPESERVRLSKKHQTTIYEMVRNPEIYNLEALLDAADLALEKNDSNLPQLHKLLTSQDIGLRYWAMVGCFLLNDKEAGLTGIDDSSHEVQAMAAWTLINTGEKEKGLACLNNLIEQKSYALLTVMNMVEWVGDPGSILMQTIHELDLTEEYRNQYKYPIRMQNYFMDKSGE